MKDSAVLKILQDGQFHSGEKLAQTLGVTRSAIWKSIQQLQAAGIPIQSQQSKGYCLEGGIEFLDEAKIYAELNTANRSLLRELKLLDSISSTNDQVLEAIRQQATLPIACLAEQQTQGRGRGGRNWVSPYGHNIYFSLGWHFDKDPAELLGLSLLAGLIILKALKRYGFKHEFLLKWPNDVLWQTKKFAGILIEVIAQSNASCELVLGIGINTQLAATASIDQAWTSLQELSQTKINRNRLAGLLLDESTSVIKDFEINGLGPYIQQWHEFDYCKNRLITLQHAKQTIRGIAQGIGEQGELILLDEQGQLRKFLSGEVTQVRIAGS